jgi:hypothetical protein
MDNAQKVAPSLTSMRNWIRRIPWLLMPVLVLSFSLAQAQQLTATLSGTATDQTDARIPGAVILVVSDTTGDKRDTKADSDGFFSVTALQPGTYTLTVSCKGFSTWKETGILLNQGDSRTVPNIHLKISSDVNSVTVVSGADAEVPVDNAEISSTLNNELVDSAVLTGRNAAELIKMMPGVTFNNNGSAGSGYNSQTTGTNNGPAGNFSANGTQPYGSTAVILDGANLIDPGNAGTQIANINQDMTDSVKFLSASYGAEYAKGPAILQAFSKSGGQKYHGEGYLYARNTGIGYANDWFNKSTLEAGAASQPGATPASIAASNQLYPQEFYYAGGNIGGPISFKGFNRNKDKLFFWAGYEDMIQHPYNSPVEMNVPTAAQLSGDFTNPGVPTGVYNPANGGGVYPDAYILPCNTNDGWQGCSKADSPWGGYGSGTPPNLKQYFDPNGVTISNLNPTANQAPNAANGWNNYVYSPSLPVNRWEATGKVTYAFNDNNKLWGSYTYQTETDEHPLSIWWAPEWAIPYPGKPVGKETAHVYLANYTHVFNASTTNEFVFSYAEFVNANSLQDPSAVNPATLGFPNQSLFGRSQDQIPDFTGGWSSGVTEISQFSFDSGQYGKNSFGKTAKDPAYTDNFTKIVKTHSIKAGFYWDTSQNVQGSSSDSNGTFDVENWGSSSTYNMTLDRLMGRNQSYNEQSSIPVEDAKWHQWSIWAQDSWKATPKLTVNVGLRADHEGQWYDQGGGEVWDPASYSNSSSPPANTGLLWHSLAGGSKIPLSGWASQLFFYDPRLGAAYDLFGTGKTVIRGGFGTYRYQVSNGDAGSAFQGPLGSFNYSTGSADNGFFGYTFAGGVLSNGPGNSPTTLKLPSGLNQTGSGNTISPDKEGDNLVPYADTWSFGVAQALPSHTVFQASYVGSGSHNQMENGGNGHIEDANAIAYGAFFTPDPKTGKLNNIAPITGTGANGNDWRPLSNYQDIYLQTHGGWANYHSLQVAAQKQSGNLFMFTNFTFGKVLGTRDGNTSNGNGNGPVVNPFNLGANYGPLAYDHTKTFNLSFSYKLPSFIHNNFLLGEAANGWQISNYTTYEDGAPLQTSTGGTLNFGVNQWKNSAGAVQQTFTMPDGLQTQSIGENTWFGTSQGGLFLPVLTCDPRHFVKVYKAQHFSPNCFAAPLPPTATTAGQEGQFIWPYIRNPGYFGSDLAIFKAFKVTESQRFEVRISATNWLNHPNSEFGQNGNGDETLTFTGVPGQGNPNLLNVNASTTGAPSSKTGYRWMQFAGKYYF